MMTNRHLGRTAAVIFSLLCLSSPALAGSCIPTYDVSCPPDDGTGGSGSTGGNLGGGGSAIPCPPVPPCTDDGPTCKCRSCNKIVFECDASQSQVLECYDPQTDQVTCKIQLPSEICKLALVSTASSAEEVEARMCNFGAFPPSNCPRVNEVSARSLVAHEVWHARNRCKKRCAAEIGGNQRQLDCTQAAKDALCDGTTSPPAWAEKCTPPKTVPGGNYRGDKVTNPPFMCGNGDADGGACVDLHYAIAMQEQAVKYIKWICRDKTVQPQPPNPCDPKPQTPIYYTVLGRPNCILNRNPPYTGPDGASGTLANACTYVDERYVKDGYLPD